MSGFAPALSNNSTTRGCRACTARVRAVSPWRLTWSTLAVELALGTLIWIRELRYWVLLAGVGLHLGIELSMNIPMFEWIMIITMLCMVDPKDMKDALTLAKEGRLFSSILSWRPQMLVKAK